MRYDVVVVAYGDRKMTQDCIDSIEECSGTDLRLIIVDNDPPASGVGFRCPDGFPVMYLPMMENLGWVKGANVGLALSTAPYVVLMNNDTVVDCANWLVKMEACFSMFKRVGAVGPRTDNTNQGQGRLSKVNQTPFLTDPHFDLKGFGIGDPILSFFCVMVSRETLNDVGYLDENLGPGLGDDDDWLFRAHLSGWKTAIHPGVLVRHLGSQSFKGQMKAQIQSENEQKLRSKHEKVLTTIH